MTEYIERDAAVKIAEKYGTCNGSALGRHSGIADIIASSIDAIPAADVAPAAHGEWEIVPGSNGKAYMVCTNCRKQQTLSGVFSYCPNCGARMDVGKENG